jgi:hypothetical protein
MTKKFLIDIEAVAIKKTGGTSSQFLKADGGIDSTAYQPMTWDYLAINWTTAPTQVGTATVGGSPGVVLAYILSGVTRYRFVPDTYDAALDSFYTSYISGVLVGLIVTRGASFF